MAAGGKGAPLVPYVDYLLFRHRRIGRIALNIGGIANITVIPAAAKPEQIIAFDTGPGNMIIDALVAHKTARPQRYDRDGRIARAAKIHPRMLDAMLSDPYFTLTPPKSAGREQFGHEFSSGLIATGIPLDDLIATATEFTARSIADAINAYSATKELIASGGGIHNRQIMRRLRELLPHLTIATTAAHGIDPDAKEAIAFAVLAHEHVHARPANIPSATGARHAAILGKCPQAPKSLCSGPSFRLQRRLQTSAVLTHPSAAARSRTPDNPTASPSPPHSSTAPDSTNRPAPPPPEEGHQHHRILLARRRRRHEILALRTFQILDHLPDVFLHASFLPAPPPGSALPPLTT